LPALARRVAKLPPIEPAPNTQIRMNPSLLLRYRRAKRGRKDMAQGTGASGEYRGLHHRRQADLAAWLARRPSEPALEPDLPIIDPHHHFWDTPERGLYFLPELLKDINSGHNIVATVFLECHAMFCASGPEQLKPVGEIEFVRGLAAQAASGQYGKCRVAEGIIGWADLMLGARVRETLEAEIAAAGGRFRGIRYGLSFDASEIGRFVSRPMTASPSSASSASASSPGNTTRSCPTRSVSPAPSPARPSSSTTSAACWVSAPTPASAPRSWRPGRRTSPSWPSSPTSP
jgi:hypothetical protein